MDRFSIRKMSWPMKSLSVHFGSVFTFFQKRNRTKLIGLVRLINLFDNIIQKIHILTNLYFIHKTYIILKYFIELCISYLVFLCSIFFKQIFITNSTQFFRGIENDIFSKFWRHKHDKTNQQMDDLNSDEERWVRP